MFTDFIDCAKDEFKKEILNDLRGVNNVTFQIVNDQGYNAVCCDADNILLISQGVVRSSVSPARLIPVSLNCPSLATIEENDCSESDELAKIHTGTEKSQYTNGKPSDTAKEVIMEKALDNLNNLESDKEIEHYEINGEENISQQNIVISEGESCEDEKSQLLVADNNENDGDNDIDSNMKICIDNDEEVKGVEPQNINQNGATNIIDINISSEEEIVNVKHIDNQEGLSLSKDIESKEPVDGNLTETPQDAVHIHVDLTEIAKQSSGDSVQVTFVGLSENASISCEGVVTDEVTHVVLPNAFEDDDICDVENVINPDMAEETVAVITEEEQIYQPDPSRDINDIHGNRKEEDHQTDCDILEYNGDICGNSVAGSDAATEVESEKEGPLWSKRCSNMMVYEDDLNGKSTPESELQAAVVGVVSTAVREAVQSVLREEHEERMDNMKQRIKYLDEKQKHLNDREIELQKDEEERRLNHIEQREKQLDKKEKLLEAREDEQLLDEIQRREIDLQELEEQLNMKEKSMVDKEAKKLAKELEKQEEFNKRKAKEAFHLKQRELLDRQQEFAKREIELKKQKIKAMKEAHERDKDKRYEELQEIEDALRDKEMTITKHESELSLKMLEAELQKNILEEEQRQINEEEMLKMREVEIKEREMHLTLREIQLDARIHAEEEKILAEKMKFEEQKSKYSEAQEVRLKEAQVTIRQRLQEEEAERIKKMEGKEIVAVEGEEMQSQVVTNGENDCIIISELNEIEELCDKPEEDKENVVVDELHSDQKIENEDLDIKGGEKEIVQSVDEEKVEKEGDPENKENTTIISEQKEDEVLTSEVDAKIQFEEIKHSDGITKVNEDPENALKIYHVKEESFIEIQTEECIDELDEIREFSKVEIERVKADAEEVLNKVMEKMNLNENTIIEKEGNGVQLCSEDKEDNDITAPVQAGIEANNDNTKILEELDEIKDFSKVDTEKTKSDAEEVFSKINEEINEDNNNNNNITAPVQAGIEANNDNNTKILEELDEIRDFSKVDIEKTKADAEEVFTKINEEINEDNNNNNITAPVQAGIEANNDNNTKILEELDEIRDFLKVDTEKTKSDAEEVFNKINEEINEDNNNNNITAPVQAGIEANNDNNTKILEELDEIRDFSKIDIEKTKADAEEVLNKINEEINEDNNNNNNITAPVQAGIEANNDNNTKILEELDEIRDFSKVDTEKTKSDAEEVFNKINEEINEDNNNITAPMQAGIEANNDNNAKSLEELDEISDFLKVEIERTKADAEEVFNQINEDIYVCQNTVIEENGLEKDKPTQNTVPVVLEHFIEESENKIEDTTVKEMETGIDPIENMEIIDVKKNRRRFNSFRKK